MVIRSKLLHGASMIRVVVGICLTYVCMCVYVRTLGFTYYHSVVSDVRLSELQLFRSGFVSPLNLIGLG